MVKSIVANEKVGSIDLKLVMIVATWMFFWVLCIWMILSRACLEAVAEKLNDWNMIQISNELSKSQFIQYLIRLLRQTRSLLSQMKLQSKLYWIISH
jgi:hypothetical protein